MARKTVSSLEARNAELEARIAALEARITVATEVYRNQKARIVELEAQLNARGAAKVVATKPCVPPVVTRFVNRSGVECERVRVGNRAVVREVQRAGVHGIEVSEVML